MFLLLKLIFVSDIKKKRIVFYLSNWSFLFLHGQDIGSRAWRWSSGPISRSDWDEPGPYQRPGGHFFWKSLWIYGENQLPVFIESNHVWDWGGLLTRSRNNQIKMLKNHLYEISNPTLCLSCDVDGDSSRPRGDVTVSGAVRGSVSVCCGYNPAHGVHPAAQQTGFPEHLQQVKNIKNFTLPHSFALCRPPLWTFLSPFCFT